MEETIKQSILGTAEKMLKEIRSLSLFVETGLKIAEKDEDLVCSFRLFASEDMLKLARSNSTLAIRVVEKYADKYANNEGATKQIKRMADELLSLASEQLASAKINYAYYMEYRNDPYRNIEETMKAAIEGQKSLFF